VLVRHGETTRIFCAQRAARSDRRPLSRVRRKRGETAVSWRDKKIILQYDEPAAPGHIGRIGPHFGLRDEQLKATIAVNEPALMCR